MNHLQDYLTWLGQQQRYSPNSLLAARRDLLRLARLLGSPNAAQSNLDLAPETDIQPGLSAQPDWSDLTTDRVRSALARLRSGGAAPASLARMASSWRGFFRYLMEQGVLLRDPSEGIRTPRKPRRLPKALSPDEAFKLLDTAIAPASHSGSESADIADSKAAQSEPTFGQLQAKVLAELLYGSGLRISEALGLDRSEQAWRQRIKRSVANPSARAVGSNTGSLGQIGGWIDWAAGEIHILGKGGKPRVVPLTTVARDQITTHLSHPVVWAAHQEERPLFVSSSGARLSVRSAQRLLAQLAVCAGLDRHVHPHMLRHSFASHVLQSSGDLRAVQELMGHASIASTQVYTALDFQHLSAAYDKAHPRARKRAG